MNFLENPCHAQAMDAIRGLVSIGEKGNSCTCSARLIWRDNKKLDHFTLPGASLSTTSHIIGDASGKELYFLCSLEIILYLRSLYVIVGDREHIPKCYLDNS